MLRKTTTKIPFDLELAKLAWEGPTDSGKEYQLLDGLSCPVRILCTDRKEGDRESRYPIIALRLETTGYEEPKAYTRNGKYFHDGRKSLFNLELWEVKSEHVLSNLERYIADKLTFFSKEEAESEAGYKVLEDIAKDVRALVKKEWPTPESAVSEESEK